MARIILLTMMMFSTFSSVSQTTISLPTMCVDSGEQVILPVHVEDFTDIGAFQFAIEFDTASLSYVTITGAPSGTAINLTGNTLHVGWVADIPYPPLFPDYLTILSGTLMNVVLNYSGTGEGVLDFVPVLEVTSMQTGVPVILSGTYINGVIQTLQTINLTSGAGTTTQKICIHVPLTTIAYAVGGSATGASITGLPPGVTGSFNAGEVTISGAPTSTGIFPYTVTTTGISCPSATATGTVTVTELPTILLTSQAGTTSQTVCQNSSITDIAYAIGGSATGAEVGGLPAGVTGSYQSDMFTISGIPTGYGTYSYTVTTTGGVCAATATGTIHVNQQPVSSITGASNVCVGSSTDLDDTGGPWVATIWNSSNPGVAKITNTGLVSGISSGLATITLTVFNGSCSANYYHPMTVSPLLPVSVSIYASHTQVCAGTPVSFTAIPVNGGSSPFYQWKVNGNNVGSNNQVYTYTPVNDDEIMCLLLSNATCVYGNPATSSTVTMIVNPIPDVSFNPPFLTISSGGTASIILNSNVTGTTFAWTATSSSPNVSGYSNGSNDTIIQTIINPDDTITSVYYLVTPVANGCDGIAERFVLHVEPAPPETLSLQNITVHSGQDYCYDALQTITVAGNGTAFIIEEGGSSTMIAGQKIIYYPGTLVESGGYLTGYIAPSGPFCLQPALPEVVSTEADLIFTHGKSFFKVYPNPTSRTFMLELEEGVPMEEVLVEIYTMRGEEVLSKTLQGEWKHEFSLADWPSGIYLIHLIVQTKSGKAKIIKL